MKKNKLVNKLLFVLSLPILIVGCDGDDNGGAPKPSTDFASIASSYYEANGTGSVIIPLRNTNASTPNDVSVTFGGTATEGSDFQLVGITQEGVEIKILDDSDYEDNETVRVQLTSSKLNLNGNSIHNITIVSNCADKVGMPLTAFAGDYNAIEKYGPNPPASNWYGPYTIKLTQDANNPNRFNITNFYDAGRTAYVLVDPAAGTFYFPNQDPLPDPGAPTLLTNSSGTFNLCTVEGHVAATISLDYDGGVWEYYLVKK